MDRGKELPVSDKELFENHYAARADAFYEKLMRDLAPKPEPPPAPEPEKPKPQFPAGILANKALRSAKEVGQSGTTAHGKEA